MHVKAAIKYVSVHHTDGFMIGKRVKEAVLLFIVVLSLLALPYKLWPQQCMASLLMKLIVNCEGKFLYFHTETFGFYISVNTSTML